MRHMTNHNIFINVHTTSIITSKLKIKYDFLGCNLGKEMGRNYFGSISDQHPMHLVHY